VGRREVAVELDVVVGLPPCESSVAFLEPYETLYPEEMDAKVPDPVPLKLMKV